MTSQCFSLEPGTHWSRDAPARSGREQIRDIVDIQLGELRKRLARRELNLEASDGAKDFLAAVGYDPQVGARPLKRAIQKHIEDALATGVLAGQFKPGDTIVVDRKDGELASSTRPGAPAEPEAPSDEAPQAQALA